MESSKKSFFAKIWIEIPIHIRMIPAVSALKRNMKTFLQG